MWKCFSASPTRSLCVCATLLQLVKAMLPSFIEPAMLAGQIMKLSCLILSLQVVLLVARLLCKFIRCYSRWPHKVKGRGNIFRHKLVMELSPM